jgi:hypothetical protein
MPDANTHPDLLDDDDDSCGGPPVPPDAPPGDEIYQENFTEAPRGVPTSSAWCDSAGNNEDEEYGHSMPTLEEARTEAAIANGGRIGGGSSAAAAAAAATIGSVFNNRHSGKHKRRMLAIVAVCTVSVALAVGFTVAFRDNRRGSGGTAPGLTLGTGGSTYTREVSRLGTVQDFLAAKLSDANDLRSPQTAQYQAALWVADHDAADVALPADPADYNGSYLFVQRYVMAVLYYALDGPNWTNQMNFLSETDVCEWGFQMNSSQSPHGYTDAWRFGVRCNDVGAISHIFIST